MPDISIPKNVLLVGSKDLLKVAISKFKAKRIKEWKATFPLYEFEEKSQKFGLSYYFYGASAAAANLEDLSKAGAENFVYLSYARPVDETIKAGSIVLPSRAVRDEGTSFHYLKPAKQVIGNIDLVKAIKDGFRAQSLKSKIGLTWTTDAPFSKVRKTKDLIKSRALVIDNDVSAMFSVARAKNLYLGGVLLVDEDTIRGRLKQRLRDPLKELKTHCLTVCLSVLSKKSLWDMLREEKPVQQTPVKKLQPKTDFSGMALWDSKIEELDKKILLEAARTNLELDSESNMLEALLVKKDVFVAQYERTKTKFLRDKITLATYNKISLTCINILEKVLQEILELELPGDQSEELRKKDDEVLETSSDVVEEIYAQLNENEHLSFYQEDEEKPPIGGIHKNRGAVFLINLPRRFRYKPYYKKFFEEPRVVKEVHYEEFTGKDSV